MTRSTDEGVTLAHAVSRDGGVRPTTSRTDQSVTVSITERRRAVEVSIDPTALTVAEGDATKASATPWCWTSKPHGQREGDHLRPRRHRRDFLDRQLNPQRDLQPDLHAATNWDDPTQTVTVGAAHDADARGPTKT